jgi:hypothetical protein
MDLAQRLQYIANDCGDHMNAVAKHFKAGAEVTLIVRSPGFPERDFMLTNDDLDEVAAVIERRKKINTTRVSPQTSG